MDQATRHMREEGDWETLSSGGGDSQVQSPLDPPAFLGGSTMRVLTAAIDKMIMGTRAMVIAGGRGGPCEGKLQPRGWRAQSFCRTTRGRSMAASDSSFHDDGKVSGNMSFASHGGSGQETNLYSNG